MRRNCISLGVVLLDNKLAKYVAFWFNLASATTI